MPLLVVATPIGNLDDITLRAISALRNADVVACEDTRHTRRLLERHGIAAPMTPYHEHNERAAAGKLLDILLRNKTVALVTNAGTPLVSDPGYRLVRAALDAGVKVEAIPGPSALTAAMSISGLPAGVAIEGAGGAMGAFSPMGAPMGMEPGMMDPAMMGMDPMMMGAPGMGMEPGMAGGAGATAGTRPPTKLETRMVPATHTVEGFEWVMGQPTVRIRSTFSVDDDKITIPTGGGGGALGGDVFGGMPGEPGMMGGMPPEPGMMGAMPGFGDSAMAMEGGMMGGAGGVEHDTSYTGERITYWAYELNRPIRIVDTIVHTLEIERQAQMGEMGMGAEMMGMPMDPMMGMPPEPGMFPGGMAPGMDPAMEPGMWGGGMGMGMGQMEPPKPMRIRVTVSLVIQETDL